MAARLHVERDKLASDVVVVVDEDHRYLARVLRLVVGDPVTLFDGHGGELVSKLLAVGVEPQAVEAPGEGLLTGKTFVFTGTLETMSRPDAEALVRKLGGKAASAVSSKTDYVVAGPGAGSKLERAQKLKVAILDEEQFLALVPT